MANGTENIAVATAALVLSGGALAEQVNLNGRPFLNAAGKLEPGQYIWEPAARRADRRS